MRDNLKRQCEQLKVDKPMADEIQDDVFGCRSGSLKIGTFGKLQMGPIKN